MKKRKAEASGRIVTFKEFSAKGYGCHIFRRMVSSHDEALRLVDYWESGGNRGRCSLAGVIA